MVRVWPFRKHKTAPAVSTSGASLPPLSGAPPHARVKTYSADSGYVYQYVYRGRRRNGNSTEFVFSVTSNRKDWTRISILLDDSAVNTWAATSSQLLMDAEKYAVVKLTLFEFFDRTPGLAAQGAQPLGPQADEIQRHMTTLGRL
jgi:hypothetical protein